MPGAISDRTSPIPRLARRAGSALAARSRPTPAARPTLDPSARLPGWLRYEVNRRLQAAGRNPPLSWPQVGLNDCPASRHVDSAR